MFKHPRNLYSTVCAKFPDVQPIATDLWKGLKMATINFIDCVVSRIARIMTIRIPVSEESERLVGGLVGG